MAFIVNIYNIEWTERQCTEGEQKQQQQKIEKNRAAQECRLIEIEQY